MKRTRSQRGFLVMAAVFLLVIVGAYVAYLANQSTVQQQTTILDVESARALQAARAGLDWGAYQVLINSSCVLGPTSVPFTASTLTSFTASVSCSASGSLTEGANTIVVYTITSTGCNAASCPSASPTSTYAERQLSLKVSKCTPNC